VPLLLTDLDNTLIDRTGAFRRWAERYVAGIGGDPAEVDWLLTADDDGFAPRSEVATAMRRRWDLTESADEVTELLLFGHLDYIQLDAEVITGLSRAAAAGWPAIVVTNGQVRQQEQKLRTAGLDRHVAGWVISEAAGFRKPDERIFQAASDLAGRPLEGGWMIGDHPRADIGGGIAAGLSTGWIRRGRSWQVLRYQPTVIADSFAEAVDLIFQAVDGDH
jgi:putative hydrolase of the HAD superfamily